MQDDTEKTHTGYKIKTINYFFFVFLSAKVMIFELRQGDKTGNRLV